MKIFLTAHSLVFQYDLHFRACWQSIYCPSILECTVIIQNQAISTSSSGIAWTVRSTSLILLKLKIVLLSSTSAHNSASSASAARSAIYSSSNSEGGRSGSSRLGEPPSETCVVKLSSLDMRR